MLIVDGDGHTVEPGDLWTARMDQGRWGDWIPHRETVDGIYDEFWLGGVLRGGGRELVDGICAKAGITPAQFKEITAQLDLPGGADPHARIADMDRDGIDAAVLYPTHSLFFGPTDPIEALHDIEFVLACQQTYNDWVADYCQPYPDRLFGVGAVPLQDVHLAAAEAERIASLGLKGVFIRPSPYIGELPLSHHVYDPFWTACQSLGLPVALHPGVHIDTPGACSKLGLVRPDQNLAITNAAVDEEYGGSALGQAVGNTVDMIVSMGRILMGGVCERFPELTFIFLESGGGWCATQLQRMDEQVEAFPLERQWLKLRPSEYFRRQCYISFDPDEWNLAASAEWIGPDRILWASDYPHPEYRSQVVKELRERVSPLSEANQRKVAGGNAVAAYRLPV